MSLVSGAIIGGLLLGGVGAGIQFDASQRAVAAQDRNLASQQRAEDLRKRQMQLEAERKRREIIRQSIIARSQATATATNQGAQFGSTLPGALGSITGQAGFGVQGVNASETIGNALFAANRDMLSANRDLAAAQSYGAIGQGLGSLGGGLLKNIGPIGRLTYGF